MRAERSHEKRSASKLAVSKRARARGESLRFKRSVTRPPLV